MEEDILRAAEQIGHHADGIGLKLHALRAQLFDPAFIFCTLAL